MKDVGKGISEKARQGLTIIAVNAIGLVQRINASPGRIDTSEVIKTLDEIETRAMSVRKEIGQ
jgi:hypothetical protein